MRKLMFLLPLFMLIVTIGARADSMNMTLTSAGGPGGFNADGGYTYPYDFTINDTTTGTTAYNIALICDDYGDEVTINESWTATSQTLAAAATGTTYLSANTDLVSDGILTSSISTTQAYYAAGYLFQELMNFPSLTAAESETFNVAIWDLFSQAAYTNNPGQTNSTVLGYPQSPAQLIQAAVNATNPGGTPTDLTPNIVVYTPNLSNPITGACSDPACKQPQEYFGEVPEPASLLLLGTGLLGMVGFMRRRSSRNA